MCNIKIFHQRYTGEQDMPFICLLSDSITISFNEQSSQVSNNDKELFNNLCTIINSHIVFIVHIQYISISH